MTPQRGAGRGGNARKNDGSEAVSKEGIIAFSRNEGDPEKGPERSEVSMVDEYKGVRDRQKKTRRPGTRESPAVPMPAGDGEGMRRKQGVELPGS